MPEVIKTPKALRPYISLGVDLEERGDNAIGDCPFCGREGKFAVNVTTGQWRCWVCGEGTAKGGGNEYTFLRLLWEKSSEATEDYSELAINRKLLDPATLKTWGACQSILTGEWLLPGYNAEHKLVQLYRWTKDFRSGKMRLMATEGLSHGLFFPLHLKSIAARVCVCEGPWDGMALWEVNQSRCVIAVPGCNVFNESWLPLFSDREVALLYDNDHPRMVNKRLVDGGALAGARRVAGLLSSYREPAKRVAWLCWGEGGHDPDLPHGYDVRDWLTAESNDGPGGRQSAAEKLLGLVADVPPDWLTVSARSSAPHTELELLPCESWKDLTNVWRKALKWSDGLERALAVMLAVAASVKLVGDQLWVKIMSPPSTGKSVLAEALSVAKKYVKAVSTFRGFYSGYQEDKEGKGRNYSLIEQLDGKAFVVKDGDTLLTLPNRSQVLGQARDLFDTVGRSQYNNKMSRDWENKRFAWILLGTKTLRLLDHSELGQRFLDCRIMDDIDGDLEGEIGWRKINQVRNSRYEVDGKPDTTDTKEMIEAKRLTGGYLSYLRANMESLYLAISMSDAVARQCVAWGQFVAILRARPSKVQDEEEAGREMSTRLISQIGKLTLSLAVVLNYNSVDEDVVKHVRRVVLDTAQGRTLVMVRKLYEAGEAGMTADSLGVWIGETAAKERQLLVFLQRLGAVKAFKVKSTGLAPKVKWRLTPMMRSLYEKVMGG